MFRFLNELKGVWLWMLEPPWRHSAPNRLTFLYFSSSVLEARQPGLERRTHWFIWLVGWAWALAGLLLGACIAPALVQYSGLANTRYQDALVIGFAFAVGFLVQLLGWYLLIRGVFNLLDRFDDPND